MKKTGFDKELVRELTLVAENTRDLYGFITWANQNLAKKKANGTFDKSKAAKAYLPAVKATMQWYKKNYGLGIVSDKEKQAIAENLLESNIDDVNYQAKALKKMKSMKKSK